MASHSAVEAFGNSVFVSNHDNHRVESQELIAAAKAHGSLFISQLSPVGRQGGKAPNPAPFSASEMYLQVKWACNEFARPRALEVDEIKKPWEASQILRIGVGKLGMMECRYIWLKSMIWKRENGNKARIGSDQMLCDHELRTPG